MLGDAGARYHQTKLPFKYAGHHPLYEQHKEWMTNLEFVALVRDKEGNYRKVGDLVTPCDIIYKSAYGLKGGDFSGTEFELNVEVHKRLWPYYTGAITMAA